jgi:nitrite reductase (NADH) small subunit
MSSWQRVCPLDRLTPDRGAVALVGGAQVAIFRLSSGEVYAVGNRDPFSGVQVLARGIVGDRGGVPKVASPLYKQSFCLRTGICLDDPDVDVPTYPVRIDDDGWVAVAP